MIELASFFDEITSAAAAAETYSVPAFPVAGDTNRNHKLLMVLRFPAIPGFPAPKMRIKQKLTM